MGLYRSCWILCDEAALACINASYSVCTKQTKVTWPTSFDMAAVSCLSDGHYVLALVSFCFRLFFFHRLILEVAWSLVTKLCQCSEPRR